MHVHGGLGVTPQLTRSLESELESACKSGELKLQCKNLREFPNHGNKYDLRDTVMADLSRNKLVDVPNECTEYASLEKLVLYHNTIRNIPESIAYLQSLQYLDISRNQLSYLPSSVCQLPLLQCLVANNNRLVSLPEEIGQMSCLMQLDVSCNEIAHLPPQIGDCNNLRSLDLRRNHLQEVPVEVTYLQLSWLDLSGNRLSTLPVELRFMVTLVDLHLHDNPLTCPPANLCCRGRVHIFKYLETQAIKEDKKRGVLTDGEYRRSYRKTSQLNDMRFGGGLCGDARRKRHTADSGYGSEQPLDRRWSQEFSQEVADQHTEDARRLAHRAVSYRPLAQPPTSRPLGASRPHPSLVSQISGSSSGFSSLGACTAGTAPPRPAPSPGHSSLSSTDRSDSAHGSTSASSPTTSLDMILQQQDQKLTNGDCPDGKQPSDPRTTFYVGDKSDLASQHGQEETVGEIGVGRDTTISRVIPIQVVDTPDSAGGDRDSPDDLEKEETRRTAQRVFSKQGASVVAARQNGRLPLPLSNPNLRSPTARSPLTSPTSPTTRSPLASPTVTVPNPSSLPTPNSQLPVASSTGVSKGGTTVQTYRQFKEQQRLSRLTDSASSAYRSDTRLVQSDSRHIQSDNRHLQQDTRKSVIKEQRSVTKQSSQDLKSMQKEAVLSYVDRVGPPRAGPPPDTTPPPPPPSTHAPSSNGHASPGRRLHHSYSGLPSTTSRTTSIPTARTAGSGGGGRARYGAVPVRRESENNLGYTARRDADKLAVQDTHIHHLRQQIESRLKVSLGDDLPAALTDGVVLCHIANHVSPRSVSSIHVPSPAVVSIYNHCTRG
jgi:Leucine-rich repeat (LRR) protein